MVKKTKNSYPNVKDAEALKELHASYEKSQGVIGDPFKITPELAEYFLETFNTRNRPISKANVKDLKQKMDDGSYRLNGEPIIFDWDGIMTNGQHTLKACVESGKTIEKYVILGLNPETFASLDGGKTRKLDDVLSVHGEDHAKELAVALRLVHILTQGKKVRNMGKFHHDAALKELKGHPDLKDSVSFILEMETPCSYVLSPGYAAALHYLMMAACDDESQYITVEQFWKDVIEMDGVQKNSPASRLNKRLLAHKQRAEGKHLTRDQITEHCIKAWCLYKNNEDLKRELNVPKSEEGTWFIGGLHTDQKED